MKTASRVLLAGIGNTMRADDGAGPAVVSLVVEATRDQEHAWPEVVTTVSPEPMDLLLSWESADLAIVVDAARSGGHPGEVSVNWLDQAEPGPHDPFKPSTHSLGVADVWQIARLIGSGPRRCALVVIEGEDFSNGEGLSPRARAGVAEATSVVIDLIDHIGVT